MFPFRESPTDDSGYMYDFAFSSEYENFGKVYLAAGTYQMLCWLFEVDGTPTLYQEEMIELISSGDNTYEIPYDGYYIFNLQVKDSDTGTIYFSPVTK